jgi:hypothetical protein
MCTPIRISRPWVAPPNANGAQFREPALGDALANSKGLGRYFRRLRESYRIGPSCPSRLGEDTFHRRFEHGAKCPAFAQHAFPLQSNDGLGLLAGRGDLSLGHADGYDSRCERKTACDQRLPVIEPIPKVRVAPRRLGDLDRDHDAALIGTTLVLPVTKSLHACMIGRRRSRRLVLLYALDTALPTR